MPETTPRHIALIADSHIGMELLRDFLSQKFVVSHASCNFAIPTRLDPIPTFLVHMSVLERTQYTFAGHLSQAFGNPHIVAYGHHAVYTVLRKHNVRGFIPIDIELSAFTTTLDKCIDLGIAGFFPKQQFGQFPALTEKQIKTLVYLLEYHSPKELKALVYGDDTVSDPAVTSMIRTSIDNFHQFFLTQNHSDFMSSSQMSNKLLQARVLLSIRSNPSLYATLKILFSRLQ